MGGVKFDKLIIIIVFNIVGTWTPMHRWLFLNVMNNQIGPIILVVIFIREL